MNKRAKRWGSWVMTVLLLWQMLALAAHAQGENKIQWGDAHSAVYDGLQDTILMYKNELYAGGYSLSLQKTTSKKSEADFVVNTYADMGASGVVQLDEELGDPTDMPGVGSFATSVRLRQGGVYLVELHDGSFAKLRVDRLTASRLAFSYVQERASAPEPTTSPTPQPTVKPTPTPEPTSAPGDGEATVLEEGNVVLKWEGEQKEAAWDIYRSDNGGSWVRLNDFQLSSTLYSDKYALSGHVYLYKVVAYSLSGTKIRETAPFKVSVVAKGSVPSGPTPTPTPASKDKAEIVLQLNNKKATVNGQAYELEVAPRLIQDSTVVPVRFVAEGLGAKVDWDGSDRSVIIRLNKDVIHLWIDSVEATVNDNKVLMTLPATIIDDVTLVPLRFVSENLKQTVQFINDTREIKITSDIAAGDSEQTPKPDGGSTPSPTSESDLSFYFHLWQLAIPGVAYQTEGQGLHVSVGALSGGLLLNKDGTYLWNSTWDGRLIEGNWKRSNDGSYPIVLLNAQEGKDWYVGKTNSGDGLYVYDGNSIYYQGVQIE